MRHPYDYRSKAKPLAKAIIDAINEADLRPGLSSAQRRAVAIQLFASVLDALIVLPGPLELIDGPIFKFVAGLAVDLVFHAIKLIKENE